MDCSAAPFNDYIDQMKNDIKYQTQKILEKYFENRDFNKQKVEIWKDYALEEITYYLNSYHNYGFIVSFNIVKLGNVVNTIQINRYQSDYYICETINSGSMFVDLTIVFYKKYSVDFELINIIKEDTLLKMNEILTSNLDEKGYSCDNAKYDSKKIVEEFNYYFLNKVEQKPCSCQICTILEKPIEQIFDFKIIGLNYIPLITSYSNNSLYGRLLLIVLKN